jgi:hypothetical protein
MIEFVTYFVGKRYIHKGKIGKCIAETDSGNIKLAIGNEEVWTTYHKLTPIDGSTRGFIVFPLPEKLAA